VTFWSVALIGVALLLLAGIPVFGLISFSRERAEAVRLAEEQSTAVVEQINHLRFRHPEIIKAPRLDRHDTYIWVNAALGLYGLVVMFVTVPYSNLGSQSLGTQQSLGGSLLLGSVLTLTGSLLGCRIGKWRIGGIISQNLVSQMLGDDVRVPYALAWCGLLSTAVSMGFYSYTVASSAGPARLFNTLGGLVCICIGLSCLTLVPKFILGSRHYVRARAGLLEEALGRIEQERP
jgi:hypothetical protein